MLIVLAALLLGLPSLSTHAATTKTPNNKNLISHLLVFGNFFYIDNLSNDTKYVIINSNFSQCKVILYICIEDSTCKTSSRITGIKSHLVMRSMCRKVRHSLITHCKQISPKIAPAKRILKPVIIQHRRTLPSRQLLTFRREGKFNSKKQGKGQWRKINIQPPKINQTWSYFKTCIKIGFRIHVVFLKPCPYGSTRRTDDHVYPLRCFSGYYTVHALSLIFIKWKSGPPIG